MGQPNQNIFSLSRTNGLKSGCTNGGKFNQSELRNCPPVHGFHE